VPVRGTPLFRTPRQPPSTRRVRNASLCMPRPWATTCAIGGPDSKARRTARSRNSSEYFHGAAMTRASPSPRTEPGLRASTRPRMAQPDRQHPRLSLVFRQFLLLARLSCSRLPAGAPRSSRRLSAPGRKKGPRRVSELGMGRRLRGRTKGS